MANLMQDLGINFNAQSAAQAGASTIDIVLYGLLIICITLVIFVVLKVLSYKHKVHIMRITGSTIIHTYDKAKIWKDSKGIMWFRLLKAKHKDRVPTAETKGVTNKGRYHFDIYYMEDKGYIFADQKSETVVEALNKIRTHKYKDAEGKEIEEQYSIADNLEAWSTEDRTLAVIQAEEAKEFKEFNWKTWLNEHGGILISGITLVLVIVGITIMLEAVMPYVEAISKDRLKEAESYRLAAQAMNRVIDYLNASGMPAVVPQ